MKEKFILCIDDERMILNSLNKQISDRFGEKYNIEIAESGEEALDLFKEIIEDNGKIVMVISDQIMPGLKGDQVLAKIEHLDKNSVKILLTGQADLDAAINMINNANLFRYIQKPWSKEDLLLTIEKGLKQYYLVNKLADQVETFSKFVPQRFLEYLGVKEYQHISLGLSENKDLCTCFLDIRNFTTFSANHTSKEVITLLNTMFGQFSKIISNHNGFIDKYIGDAIMAIFDERDIDKAVIASIKIIEALNKLKQDGVVAEEINIGIGFSLGSVMIGTIGSQDRIDTTVIGDSVNTSSRIEPLTKQYDAPILITENIYQKLQSNNFFHIRLLDYISLKGKSQKLKIYEVYNTNKADLIVMKDSSKKIYEEIINLYIQDDESFKSKAFDYLGKYPQDYQAKIILKFKVDNQNLFYL